MKRPLDLSDTTPVFDRIRQAPNRNNVPVLLFFSMYLVIEFVSVNIIYRFLPAMHSPSDEVCLQLYLTLVSIVLVFIFCLWLEHRPVRTLGLTRHHCLRDYLTGILLGVGFMGLTVLIAWAGGGLRFDRVSSYIDTDKMLLFLLGWMIQGFSEELTCRGYLMMSEGAHGKPAGGVLISAVMFAAMHLGNNGIGVFPLINLTLFGILAALVFLRTDSIWCAAAMHSFWNMAQGNLFGIKVSGIRINQTILNFIPETGKDWLNGGSFGLEGGAATTITMLSGILIFFFLPQRRQKQQADFTVSEPLH